MTWSKSEKNKAWEEWKRRYAWDVSEDELEEIVKNKERIVEEELWAKFRKERTSVPKISLRNFNKYTCNRIGGIWEKPKYRRFGSCKILDIGDIRPKTKTIRIGRTEYGRPKIKWVSEFEKPLIRIERRDPEKFYDIPVEAKEVRIKDSCELKLGKFPYLWCDVYKGKAEIYVQTDEDGDRILKVSAGPMSDEERELAKKINQEIHDKVLKRQKFDISEIMAKYNRIEK